MSQTIVHKTKSNAILPARAHGAALGHKIYSLHQATIPPHQIVDLTSGLALEKREDRIAFLFGAIPNSENSFVEVEQAFIETGKEILVRTINHGSVDYEVDAYSTLSRIVLLKCFGGEPNVVNNLEATERGEKGYGSTGLVN